MTQSGKSLLCVLSDLSSISPTHNKKPCGVVVRVGKAATGRLLGAHWLPCVPGKEPISKTKADGS